MFNTYNNQSLRKLVVAFGSLFDEIYVTRKNDTTGVEENIKVPITFSSKEKFLRRLESNSSITDKVKTQLNLPYMSFELVNIVYDRGRKRNKLKVASTFSSSTEITSKTFSETPIQVEFRLYFYSRSLEEILQITEQILPTFNPEFNVRINFNDVFSNINVPISYDNMRLLDDYEGNLGSRRILIGTMVFTASSFVFNEIKTGDPPNTTSLRITSLLQGDEDLVEETQSIVINENLPISFYSIPSGTLNTQLTWAENGNFSQKTYVLFLNEDTGKEVAQFAVDAGTLTISGSDYTALEQAMVEDRSLCGSSATGGFFRYRMIVSNGSTVATQSFVVISITGTGIC